LEEVVGDLHAPVLGSVVLASATSWAVLQLLLGNHPLFAVPQYQLVHPVEFALYAVLGVAGGLVSAAFSGLLLKLREKFLAASRKTLPFQPIVGGVLVGLMGWFVPQTLGVGYVNVGSALNGSMAWRLMALLLVLKLVSVAVSYASGNAGGIFGPSLFLGAMLGGVVGTAGHYFFPNHVAASGAYALVGMGTAFAGIVRAPMTSVMMIFEITRDYSVIVPLMISNLVSFFIASRFQKPIYEVLAHQDGIHLPTAESRVAAGNRQVLLAMQPIKPALKAEQTVGEALQITEESGLPAWPVCDHRGVIGVLGRVAIAAAAANGHKEEKLAVLLPDDDFPHLHTDHSLDAALDRMGASGLDALPVVSRANVHKLVGVVTFDDVLALYRRPSPRPVRATKTEET
jgi:chloride channel protein, CIC family